MSWKLEESLKEDRIRVMLQRENILKAEEKGYWIWELIGH